MNTRRAELSGVRSNGKIATGYQLAARRDFNARDLGNDWLRAFTIACMTPEHIDITLVK